MTKGTKPTWEVKITKEEEEEKAFNCFDNEVTQRTVLGTVLFNMLANRRGFKIQLITLEIETIIETCLILREYYEPLQKDLIN